MALTKKCNPFINPLTAVNTKLQPYNNNTRKCVVLQELFESDSPVQKKMDRLLDLAEQVTPTLDMNDKTTLKESIASLSSQVSEVTTAADSKLKQLVTAEKDYKQYRVGC